MKFISADYNKENGHSTVIMQHLGRKFIGEARLNPAEAEKGSEYTGCKYAEIRATIRALKYERQIAKEAADQAIDFVKSCNCYAKFDSESETAKAVYRQLNQRIKRVNDLTDEINNLYKELNDSIFHREIMLNAIAKNKAKKVN